MRDTALKVYAATTCRELVGLGKKLYGAIEDDLMHRRSASPPTERDREDHESPIGGPRSSDDTRTPFSRELGDTWVEVEPGIYKHAPSDRD